MKREILGGWGMSKCKYLCGSAIAASVLFCLSATTAMAAAGGQVVINPKVKAGVDYNSNFWKAANDEVGVLTYYMKPGVVLGYETAKTKVKMDATVDAFAYDDQDTPPAGVRDSSDDNYVGFTGLLDGSSQVTDRLKLGLRDNLILTRDPASADEFSDSVAREKYTINRITPSLYYSLGDKFGLGAKYRNTYTDYTEDLGGEDSTEHRGIFNLFYNLNRSSAVYLDYQVWNREYDVSTSEYTSNKVTINYAQTFNIFTLTAGGGYHNRSFEIDGLDDIDVFSWNISFKGKEQVSDERKPRYWLDTSLSQGLNDAGTGEQYFIATNFKAEAGYLFFGKLGTSAKFEFQNSEYQNHPENRDDDTVTVSAKLTYAVLDYLTLGINGGVKDRDSNVAGKTYDDQFVGAFVDFNYNLGGR